MTTSDAIALANVIVAALTPLAVVAVGYWVNRKVGQFERAIERENRLTGTRFELYKDIGFQLNDIFAYFSFVGTWKKLSPVDIIERKRELDRHVYTYRPLFNDAFFEHYIAFTKEAFLTHNGWGQDARLRTLSLHRPEDGDGNAMRCFTQEDNLSAIKVSYGKLISCLADNLGVGREVAP